MVFTKNIQRIEAKNLFRQIKATATGGSELKWHLVASIHTYLSCPKKGGRYDSECN